MAAALSFSFHHLWHNNWPDSCFALTRFRIGRKWLRASLLFLGGEPRRFGLGALNRD
jgi:hypothetical protein